MKAIWKGKVIAESSKTYKIENNIYFPPDTVRKSIYVKAVYTHSATGKEMPPTLMLLWMER